MIYFVLQSHANSNLQNNSDRNYNSNCEIKNDNIICLNFEINNNLNVNLLTEPHRIIINFQNKINLNTKHNYLNILKGTIIKNVRLSQRVNSGSTMVIEMKKPGVISEILYDDMITKKERPNLKIKIAETTEGNFAIAKHTLSVNNGNILSLENVIDLKNLKKTIKLNNTQETVLRPKKIKAQNKDKAKEKHIVFIDPGHGGKDPGAIGQLGTLEKNITLKASILLKKTLKKNKIITPILSRNKDIYLSLRDRVKLANLNKADILISIHADSSKNSNASGISVFSLSDKASDKEAQILAVNQNKTDKIFGLQNKIDDPVIYGTLIKMFQREAMNDSAFLAKQILFNLEQTKLTVNRGHRFAGFAVLKSYDIPSILVEIGFLSNLKEEKKLLDQKYLVNLIDGLAKAIESYFLVKKK